MNLETIENDMADHIVRMARVDGFKDYARERLRELVSEKSGLFDNLSALVKEKLKESEK